AVAVAASKRRPSNRAAASTTWTTIFRSEEPSRFSQNKAPWTWRLRGFLLFAVIGGEARRPQKAEQAQ
ncbi:hypothetical protein, partial [Pandoraea apista]|uniref:hypothetical protein n=1 Tax=Pandoraea apista TaxID=93218 RepID=UPI001C8C358F